MSVRQTLLALLIDGPKHGYQLRSEHDAAAGGGKPLNLGQVYTTLERLERDGLVTQVSGDDVDDSGDPRRKYFSLTPAGRDEAEQWFATPLGGGEQAGRDELATKVVLALTAEGIDELAVIHVERLALVARLQELRQASEEDEALAQQLLRDAAAARLEAEMAWLDRSEAQVRAARRRSRSKARGRKR